MNLPLFLRTVDRFTRGMSHEELEVFIHEIARTLPEKKRDTFIEQLKSVGTVEETETAYGKSELLNKEKLTEELKSVQDMLVRIDEGEFLLTSGINEEYDDWYNSDADEFLFEDPENILGTIDTAMDLVHRCVDTELYEEGYELAELLSVIAVQDEGEYNDCVGEVLYLEDLEMHHLLTCDYRQLCRDALYLAYTGNVLDERADAVYRMMQNLKCRNVSLEEMMQSGKEELRQFDEFLELWIEYLGSFPGGNEEKLIQEAQLLINDDEKELENARRYAKQYPRLYEQYLKKKLTSGEDSECFELGRTALLEVPEASVWRSRIALLTARYALRLEKPDEAEECWLEAFRSVRNPVNYMRIFIESRDYARFAKEVSDICMSSGKSKDYYALMFLEGRFRKVIEEGMNVKEALGWSFTFMKDGMALFLLYLYCGEELPSGMVKMRDRAAGALGFSKEEYSQGLEKSPALDDRSLFMECFGRWKKRIAIPEEECREVMDKLEAWIEIRVEGIMRANRRNYYGECASFVAAYGEVRESRGERNGKQSFMDTYRQKYSRRSAFRQELKAYGYRGK